MQPDLKIEEVEKELEDVEFYSPTTPLRWQKYHAIIRSLIAKLKVKPPRTFHGVLKELVEGLEDGSIVLKHPTEEENPELWELFHKIWGQAKESPEYDKKAFQKLETYIRNLERGKNG